MNQAAIWPATWIFRYSTFHLTDFSALAGVLRYNWLIWTIHASTVWELYCHNTEEQTLLGLNYLALCLETSSWIYSVRMVSTCLIRELAPSQNCFYQIEILCLMATDHGAQMKPLSPAQWLPMNGCCRGLGHFNATETVSSWETGALFILREEAIAQNDRKDTKLLAWVSDLLLPDTINELTFPLR